MRLVKSWHIVAPVLLGLAFVGILGLTTQAESTVWAYVLVGDGDRDKLLGTAGDWEQQMFLTSAERIENGLVEGWHVPKGQIEAHHAWGMSHGDFLTTMEEFAARDDGDDLLIFYYVGHGTKDTMVPCFSGHSITGAAAVAISLISYENMYAPLKKEGGDRLVILDSCNSGSAIPVLHDFAWVMASICAEWGQFNWPNVSGGTAFSAFLAQAMREKTGLRAAFQKTEMNEFFISSLVPPPISALIGRGPQLCGPQLSSP